MLKLAGETKSVREKIESIVYEPTVPDTGDLEATTKTITATSKPGTADYSQALTLSKPGDSRIVVKRIGVRLQVTRDSGTSANLYCTVSVDSADGSTNKLFDGVDVQANNLQVASLTSGTIFDLLTDGASHTFYFFFWVDSGDSVISLVQLQEAVGNTGTSNLDVIQLDHVGFVSFTALQQLKGTGAMTGYYFTGTSNTHICTWAGLVKHAETLFVCPEKVILRLKSSVATDLVCLYVIEFILRSEK